ncbi:MAG: hypothetical protein GX640_05095 [Fibrobacter sp.]|nr:hypothetical protein [Fibrobacter sp.]
MAQPYSLSEIPTGLPVLLEKMKIATTAAIINNNSAKNSSDPHTLKNTFQA